MQGTQQLPAAVHSVERGRRVWRAVAALGAGVGAAVALLLLTTAVDAAFALPAAGLWIATTLLAGAALGVLVAVVVRLATGWNTHAAARAIESRLNLTADELTTSLAFAAAPASDGTSQALRDEAVRRGEALAGRVAQTSLGDRRRVRRAWLALACVAIVLAATGVLFPRIYAAVLPRLVQPWADLPPYTSLRFDVTVEPDAIHVGKSARITAVVTGGPTRQATLVLEHPDGCRERTTMYQKISPGNSGASADTYTLDLSQLDTPGVMRFYVEASGASGGGGRSAWREIAVLPTPLFERVHAELDYPSYTQWKPGVVDLLQQRPASRDADAPLQLQALVGTRVTLTAQSNVALREGVARITDRQGASSDVTLMRDANNPTQVRGGFTLARDGELSLELVGEDGSRSRSPLVVQLHALEDQPPTVEIVSPDAEVWAPEGWKVDVEARASDDIGIQSLAMRQGVNDQWNAPQPMHTQDAPHSRVVTGVATIDLDALGAKAGDTVRYYASAAAVAPSREEAATPVTSGGGGGGGGDSPTYRIRVITMQQYQQVARMRYRIDDLKAEWQAMQDQLDALAAKREALLAALKQLQKQLAEQSDPPTAAQREKMQQLAKQLDDYSNDALDLFEQMRQRSEAETLYAFESDYKDLLRRTGAELQAQANTANALAEQMPPETSESAQAMQAFNQALNQFEKQRRPFDPAMHKEREQTTHDIDKLQRASQFFTQLQKLADITRRQRDLAAEMGQFHREDDAFTPLTPAEELRLKTLGHRQQELEQQLRDVMTQMKSQCESSGESLPQMCASAKELTDAIEQMQVTHDQAAAAKLAERGDGDAAFTQADAAADKLESLVANGDMTGEASQDLDGALRMTNASLQQAAQQMAQASGLPTLPGTLPEQLPGQLPGASAQAQPGATGTGASAARLSDVQLVGPRRPEQGDEQNRRGGDRRNARAERGDGRQFDETLTDPGDRIEPGRTTERTGGRAAASQVPPGYVEATEAYFRRLAEDEADAN